MNSHSTRSFVLIRGCALILLLGSVTPFLMGASKTEEHSPQVVLDAASADTDFKTHLTHRKDVKTTYGKMTVRADRALTNAADFKNSHWTLDGNVRINAEPRGNLRSDEAIVEFEDNQLKRATATGNPAEFDQQRDESNIIAHGHANQIVYEVGAGKIRLSDNAWVADGKDEMRAPVITYDLREERVEGASSSSDSGRVHVTIAPGEGLRSDPGATNKGRPPAPDSNKPQPAPPQASPPASDANPPPR